MRHRDTTNDSAYNSYDGSPILIQLSIVMPILSVIAVGLRIWARRRRQTKLGIDDWLIIVAQLMSFGIPAAAVVGAVHGVGKHESVVEAESPYNMQWIMGDLFVGEFAYIILLLFIKLSILQLYYRIFPTRYMKWATLTVSAILLAWCAGSLFATLFQCNPISAAWDKDLLSQGATCVDQGAYFIGIAAPHTATDILILAVPWYEMSKLQMPKWQKLAITCMFLLGSFIVVVSIIRLTTLIDMYHAGPDGDVPILLLPIELWTVTEVSVAIICACLPTLGPVAVVVARFFRTRLASRLEKSSGGRSTSFANSVSHHSTRSQGPDGAFRRLEGSASGGHSPYLIPKGYSHEMNVMVSGKEDAFEINSDEVPLKGIHVKKDVTWEEARQKHN
ncbi:hypothetical protein BX600DRAFT_266594 [Xylariales sp. PMI_506]|nr:hypothetical protein BX600DRAFT_266594 [Xylariales sp. PMI_506]